MEKTTLVSTAIVACLILFSAIVLASRKHVHPIKYQESILCFLLGALTCFALFPWAWFFGHWEFSLRHHPLAQSLYGSLVMAAVPEELWRYIILSWRLRRLPSPVLLTNCLLLGSMVGLGFGSIEHVYYTYHEGWRACWERLFLAVLIHSMAGAIVGYFLGLSLILRQLRWGILGVSITILMHAAHNFILTYYYESISPSPFIESLYWPIRIIITLCYVIIVAILYRDARRQRMPC